MDFAACLGGPDLRVLGVLDGRDLDIDLLRAWGASAELVIAADGAADRLIACGVPPHIIVGDMDGMTADPGDIQVLRIEDSDSTDCDKLLRYAASQAHSDLTLTGVEGDLVDHMLSTFSSCAAFGRPVRIALRRGVGWVFTGPREVKVSAGARVSLIPITPCRGARLAGVQWPLDNADLDLGGAISVSNAAVDGFVEASIQKGVAFLFVEYAREEMPFWD